MLHLERPMNLSMSTSTKTPPAPINARKWLLSPVTAPSIRLKDRNLVFPTSEASAGIQNAKEYTLKDYHTMNITDAAAFTVLTPVPEAINAPGTMMQSAEQRLGRF